MRALKQMPGKLPWRYTYVTTQAHEGIETLSEKQFLDSDW